MVANFIILFFLISYPIFTSIVAKRKTDSNMKNHFSYYFKDILFSLILLSVIYFLNPSIYERLDFRIIGKGIIISEEWVSVILPVFFIPFFLSFTTWNNYKSRGSELLGYPTYLLPNNKKEHLLFTIYIIIGVVFEELFCRQFMFYSFSEILKLRGDTILLISSFLFAFGHLYQGWKGVLITFIFSLIWGKIFQVKENILYPIILHLFLNLTVVVLAFKRLRTLKNNTFNST